MSKTGRIAKRAAKGVNRLAGFGLSMVLLAVVTLVAIPAMIGASGSHAWSAIAVGQSVGAIAAVIVSYGWGMSGPARIARASTAARSREYRSSVLVRVVIFVPAAAIAAGIAAVFGRADWDMAVGGALAASAVGLTANWYFVGIARPYLLLLLETMPRVLGTATGIILMLNGFSALAGILLQFAGMLAAFVVCTAWILATTRVVGEVRTREPWGGRLVTALREHRYGMTSSILSAVYVSAPLLIVSAVAPQAQPVYALVDKLQRQISVAANPFVTVLQGWVPRAEPTAWRSRVRVTITGSATLCAALAVVLLAIAPWLINWLGASEIEPPFAALVLMCVFVAINLFESVLAKAVLASADRLDAVSRVTWISGAVGLAAVAVGALLWGAVGGLAGVVLGLALRVTLESIVIARHMRGVRDGVIVWEGVRI